MKKKAIPIESRLRRLRLTTKGLSELYTIATHPNNIILEDNSLIDSSYIYKVLSYSKNRVVAMKALKSLKASNLHILRMTAGVTRIVCIDYFKGRVVREMVDSDFATRKLMLVTALEGIIPELHNALDSWELDRVKKLQSSKDKLASQFPCLDHNLDTIIENTSESELVIENE